MPSHTSFEQSYYSYVPTYDFPQDLRDAQLALHRTRAALEQYARALPWSAEPLPGWGTSSCTPAAASTKPASPGYTPEQREQVEKFRAELLELSTVVMTHPYWAGLDESVVQARMALQHAHEQPDGGTD